MLIAYLSDELRLVVYGTDVPPLISEFLPRPPGASRPTVTRRQGLVVGRVGLFGRTDGRTFSAEV